MNQFTIGWIGLGNMGVPMAINLLKAGNSLIVYNRTREKTIALTNNGADAADHPWQLTEQCDIIFTMVSDDQAVKDVYLGKEGILQQMNKTKLFIDMSTVSPSTSKLIAEKCLENGAGFLDAPVSGSVKPAQDGTLIIMAGGRKEYYENARPLFDHIGKLSLYLGTNGAGNAAKLAINYLLGLNLQGLAETVLFARNNGVETKDMLTIINEGACGNGITKMKSDNILNNSYPAAFALKHLAKDLRLAKEQGLDTPLSDPLNQTFQSALKEGLGEEDVMAVFRYLDQISQ